MFFLIGVILFIVFVLFLSFYLKAKMKQLFGNVSLKDMMDMASELEEEQPKSVGSMDSIYLDNLLKDFPTLHIKEMKKIAENDLYTYFQAIEEKNKNKITSAPIRKIVEAAIKEIKEDKVSYSQIKIHKTVLNKYEKRGAVATITIAISLEYQYQKNENISKVQDRYRLEYIYIIDASKVEKNKKSIGLNCPNCGSPITELGNKKCSYCNSYVIDIAKRVWTLNNIEKY